MVLILNKRCILDDGIKKNSIQLCFLTETHLTGRTHRLKVKGWEMTYKANGSMELYPKQITF
jgi:hypothetical protein